MNSAEYTAAEIAEVRVAGFENHLELMLMGLRIMRETGLPAEQIADRLTAAWQQLSLAMTGQVVHQTPGRVQ